MLIFKENWEIGNSEKERNISVEYLVVTEDTFSGHIKHFA